MRKTLFILVTALLFFNLASRCQEECNRPAVGITYLIPKTIGLEGFFTGPGNLHLGIGVAYTHSKVYTTHNQRDSVGNTLTMFTYVGYKVYNIPYKFNISLNVGFCMGDVREAAVVNSIKFMFINNNGKVPKAWSIEPYHIWKREIGLKLTYYKKV